MPRMARWKARNLQVVMHQLIWFGMRIVLPSKELLLVVIARSPRQHAAHVQFLALYLPRHIFRPNALCRVLIVRASRRMYVMISGIPSILGWIDPSLHLELDAVVASLCHVHSLGLRRVFRPERARHRVTPLRKREGFAVVPVNLRLKEEIWRQPLRGIRINP